MDVSIIRIAYYSLSMCTMSAIGHRQIYRHNIVGDCSLNPWFTVRTLYPPCTVWIQLSSGDPCVLRRASARPSFVRSGGSLPPTTLRSVPHDVLKPKRSRARRFVLRRCCDGLTGANVKTIHPLDAIEPEIKYTGQLSLLEKHIA